MSIPPRGQADERESWLRNKVRSCGSSAEHEYWPSYLLLNNKQLDDDDAVVIADELKVNTTKTSICLSDNNIGARGAVALADALKSNTTVQHIDLSNNNIGAAGAVALADSVKSNTTVEEILLFNNNIGAAGAEALADYLKSNTTVEQIILFNNNIGASGAVALADSLKSNTSVNTINLSSNNIGADGAAAVADFLKSNTSVKTINLSRNNIGADGAVALADSLKSNATLKEIYLSSNNIGDHGAVAFADAMKSNTAIEWFYLSRNGIGDAGAAALAEALIVNETVGSVNLDNNNIGSAGAEALWDAVQVNLKLEDLYIDGNDIEEDDPTVQNIHDMLQQGAARVFPSLFRKLERNIEGFTKVDVTGILDFVDEPFDNEKARRLGESLLHNTLVTELKLPLDEELTSQEIGGSLAPLSRYIKESNSLRDLTYLLERDKHIDLIVVHYFLAPILNRPTLDFTLAVDIGWLKENKEFFRSLMRNPKYGFLKRLKFIDAVEGEYEYDLDVFANLYRPEPLTDVFQELVIDLQENADSQDNTKLETLNIEAAKPCVEFLKAVEKFPHMYCHLRSFILKVKDGPTLVQVFAALPALVLLKEFRLQLLGGAIVETWRSRQGEWLNALKQNGSLLHVEVARVRAGDISGDVLALPQQVQLYCRRNESMPRRMAEGRAHDEAENNERANQAPIAAEAVPPPLSCYPKLFHQSAQCPGMGPSWMLRGLLALKDSACVDRYAESFPARTSSNKRRRLDASRTGGAG